MSGIITNTGAAVKRAGAAYPVPTSAGIYGVGDHVGVGGPFRLEDLIRTAIHDVDPSRPVAIDRVQLIDPTAEADALVLLLWSSKPATALVDNASGPVTTEDAQRLIGTIEIAATDYITNPSTGPHAQVILPWPIRVESPGDAYFSLMTRGTPTYGGAALLLRVGAQAL